jgi:methylmalonyl-CoA mutase
MAAVLGGCNSLTVCAEDNSSMMNRIARNISNVLREESYLDKVADATSGAYAIEKMVDEIAQASWLDFQQQIKKS